MSLVAFALALSMAAPTSSPQSGAPQKQATNPQAASPQTPGATPQTEPPAKDAEQPRVHEEIVVTANRTEQASFATAVPISVVSAELLDKRMPEKVMDQLKLLAGLEVSGEGPFRGLPVIRGLSSNRVLVLVDGQRLNNARESTQFAGIQPGLVDLSMVERIEVLRGPASVMYGSDAIGGVVNIITKQQPFAQHGFELAGKIGYEYGSAASSQRGQLAVNGAGERFTFHLGASTLDVDNYESPKGEVPNSGMKQHSIDGNMRFLVGNQSLLRLEVQSTETRDVGFPGYDPKTSGVDIQFPRFDREKLAAIYETGPFLGLSGLSVSAFYQGVIKDSKRNISMGGFFSNNFTHSVIDSYGLNAQSSASLGVHKLSFGLDAYQDALHDTTTASTPYGSNNNVQVPDSDQRGFGVFVQDEIALGSRLQLAIGARGDDFAFKSKDDPRYKGTPFDVSESAVSGDISARYMVTEHVALTGLVGRGFRAPNIQERAYFGVVSDGTTYVQQNPKLAAETSLNSELGFKVSYDRYAGGFNVYHNTLSDFIGLVFLGKAPGGRLDLAEFRNFKKATINGAEFELQSFLAERWTAFTTLSYTRGTDDSTGDPLPLIPPFKAVIGARYQAPRWWTEASLRTVGHNSRVAPGYKETPGFTVYDLRGGVDLIAGLSMQLAVENLTDKAYHEPFNVRFEPGRNVKVGIGYRF